MLTTSIFCLSGSPGFAQETQQNTPAASPATIPSYSDNAKGLEKLIKEMMQLQKDGNQGELAPYVKSLALPDPDAWFKSVFGDETGARLAAASAKWRTQAPLVILKTLSAMIDAKQTEVQAVRLADACNYSTTENEYPILELRQRPEPLYDVRFRSDTREAVWSYFAYVNGSFRYIGLLEKKDAILPPVREKQETEDGKRIQIGGNVQQARIVHRVQPEYPMEAKAAGIQGTVVLHAIIAKDGSIKDLDLIKGQCLLARSSMDAVKHWQYSPTLLQGVPVEVDTTIQVVFQLAH